MDGWGGWVITAMGVAIDSDGWYVIKENARRSKGAWGREITAGQRAVYDRTFVSI
jgi:hypothetical protein